MGRKVGETFWWQAQKFLEVQEPRRRFFNPFNFVLSRFFVRLRECRENSSWNSIHTTWFRSNATLKVNKRSHFYDNELLKSREKVKKNWIVQVCKSCVWTPRLLSAINCETAKKCSLRDRSNFENWRENSSIRSVTLASSKLYYERKSLFR